MEQMNLKLDNVFSDILGKSGQSVIKAILNGERDPKVLSDLADPRCRTSKEEIEKSRPKGDCPWRADAAA